MRKCSRGSSAGIIPPRRGGTGNHRSSNVVGNDQTFEMRNLSEATHRSHHT